MIMYLFSVYCSHDADDGILDIIFLFTWQLYEKIIERLTLFLLAILMLITASG